MNCLTVLWCVYVCVFKFKCVEFIKIQNCLHNASKLVNGGLVIQLVVVQLSSSFLNQVNKMTCCP